MKKLFSRNLSSILLAKKVVIMQYTSNILSIIFANCPTNTLSLLNKNTYILDFTIKKPNIKYY